MDNNSPIKRANILEVAKLAQVSAMTVTRAFNGNAPVAEKTRNIIIEAAKKLNYQPNFFAKTLRGEKTRSIGILWSLAPHTSVRTIRNISSEFMKNGYVSYIADSLSDPEIMNNALRDYLNRSVDGLICQFPADLASNTEILEKIKAFPSKVLITYKEMSLPSDQIIHDRFSAMTEMADHFAKTGRKRVLIISSSPSNFERIEVFIQRLKRNGIKPLVPKIIDSKSVNDPLLGQKFVNTLRSEYPGKMPFDAIWCTCDEGAAAAMKLILERGYSVPKDIAVAGFNNSEMANYLTPPLASVQRSDDELVSSAVQMLLERMRNPGLPFMTKSYSMKFIARESAGPK